MSTVNLDLSSNLQDLQGIFLHYFMLCLYWLINVQMNSSVWSENRFKVHIVKVKWWLMFLTCATLLMSALPIPFPERQTMLYIILTLSPGYYHKLYLSHKTSVLYLWTQTSHTSSPWTQLCPSMMCRNRSKVHILFLYGLKANRQKCQCNSFPVIKWWTHVISISEWYRLKIGGFLLTFFGFVLFRNLSNDSMKERVLGEAVLLQVCKWSRETLPIYMQYTLIASVCLESLPH